MLTAGPRGQFTNLVTNVAAFASVLGGFGLLRLSAVLESYLLLFLAFGLMVWGILALFTGHGRPGTA